MGTKCQLWVIHNSTSFSVLTPHQRRKGKEPPGFEITCIDLLYKGTHFTKFKETVQKDILGRTDSPIMIPEQTMLSQNHVSISRASPNTNYFH